MAKFVYKPKKYVSGIDYDKDTDYTYEIEQARKRGESEESLAALEEKRNRKIDGENLPYRKTYEFVDIGTKIEDGIRNRISPEEMKELVDARRDKAYQNGKYDIYKNDEIQKRGLKYYYDSLSGAGIEHENRPVERRSYDAKIQSLLNKISSVKDFEYDPEEDIVYTGLKKQMQNESRRAATDVLAEVEQQTGGKSSYAVSAAMQAANNYNSKLAEEMPRLAELAYKRFKDGIENHQKALDYTLKASEKEHKEYLDKLDEFNADREYATDSYENALDRYIEEDENKFDAQMKVKELDYEKEQDRLKAEADKIKETRDLILNYEKDGITVPEELLTEGDMLSFAPMHEERASVYRNKLNLEALAKSRQIENTNASIAQKYNKIALDNKKYQDEKDEKGKGTTEGEMFNTAGIKTMEDLTARGDIVNNIHNGKIYIGGNYISLSEFIAGCESGEILVRVNQKGKTEFVLAEE